MPKPTKIAVAVLAAGQASRMGGANKMLLPFGEGLTILGQVLFNVDQLDLGLKLVVTGRDRALVEQVVPADFKVCHNATYETGMASSLRTALDAIDETFAGVLVVLGDMPMIKPETMSEMLHVFQALEEPKTVVPTHEGQWGNPVLLSRAFFDPVRNLSADKGARTLLKQNIDKLHLLPVEDAGVLVDVDTPEAYAALNP
ncbi:MAG: nucleotidyltransferase family protein [Alphaproteobacteria bacterium]